MNKSILLVVVVASALTVGLYSLPKVAVRNEDKKLGGRVTDQVSSQTPSDFKASGMPSTAHNAPLAPEQKKRVDELKQKLATAGADQKEAVTGQLMAAFKEASRYDSAAYYAGKLAENTPNERTNLLAGDAYFEAFGFAVDDQKSAYLGEQTRAFYKKALDNNPNLLTAKANMAMTYVSTQTPMQGIMLLREVLQQDPTNELALFNLGLLSMKSGQYQRAIDRFRQILTHNPASRKAQFYLGISLAEAGQKDEARKVLAQVKTREKDPQVLAAVREYEERLK